MPALKDWFGDWSDQHSNAQAKKDTSDPNNPSSSRRFPRRDQDEGENARSTFRSTLSQPSQMGNFRHQSIRGDLTRSGDRDRDRDADRDKEGHERLRSLSDMYDRERFNLPSTLSPLMRTQHRDSSGHHSSSSISGTGTSTRLSGRERVDRERDKDNTRRNENREPTRRKGGESVDWRRGTDASRFGKDEPRGEGDRERSTSRERWSERREDSRRGRDGEDKDRENEKPRLRDEDRKTKTKETDTHTTSGTSNRWSERLNDEKRKSKDDNDKDIKEERKDRDNKRDKAREHPDIKRDRELREGWTIEERGTSSMRRTSGRNGERRTGADEDKELRKEREREKDKEPAWMDDYVPEAGAPKTGIFGGKMDGMEDEIQAWKKRQGLAKQQTTTTASSIPASAAPAPSNGSMSPSASSESFPRDGTVLTTELVSPNPPSLTTDEQAKASDAFFFGLMKGDGKAKSHSTTPAKSPEPEVPSTTRSPAPVAHLSHISSPSVDPAKADPAIISAAPHGPSKSNNPSVSTPSDLLPHSHDTNPGSSLPPFTSSTPGPLGSSALSENDSSFKIPHTTTPPASISFNPPAQSRVLAFTQSQRANSNNSITSPTGQLPIHPIGVIGSQPSPKPFPPNRRQPSPLVSDNVTRGLNNSFGGPDAVAQQRLQALENIGVRSGFSPFDNSVSGAADGTPAGGAGFASSRQSSVDLRGGFNAVEALLPDRNPRSSPQTLLSQSSVGQAGTHDSTPSPSSSMHPGVAGRGSRFAKFWDKSKDAVPNTAGGFQSSGGMLSQQGIPAPPQSVSPSVSQQGRQHDLGPSSLNGFSGNPPVDNIQDMLAMLQSSQSARLNPQSLLHRPSLPSHLHALHEQHIPHHQPQPQHHFTNTNSLLEHQFDGRPAFMPDGLVPGLRPTRGREGSIYASDIIDDASPNAPFAISVQQRQGPQSQQQQQQQQFDRQTPGIGGLPQLFNNQNASGSLGNINVGIGAGGGGGGNGGGRMFQPPFRGEPSPLSPNGPNTLHRLPPGLANLGGRPPHDPNAYLNGNVVGGMGLGGVGLGGIPGNPVVGGGAGGPQHQHQSFNGFGGGATPSANFGIGGMGGMGSLGGMNVGGGGVGGLHAGQRGSGGPGQLPIQSLLNSGGGNGMLSGHHPDFTVQPQHHHPGIGVGMRGGLQGQQQLQQQQQASHGHLSLGGGGGGGPPTGGIPGGLRGQFVQPGASGPGGPGAGGLPSSIQAQLGIRQQQQQHMMPGVIPPPQLQHLGPQQQHGVGGGGGGLHGLHPGHGHGHGQTQNEHLLSMLMGGLVPRE